MRGDKIDFEEKYNEEWLRYVIQLRKTAQTHKKKELFE